MNESNISPVSKCGELYEKKDTLKSKIYKLSGNISLVNNSLNSSNLKNTSSFNTLNSPEKQDLKDNQNTVTNDNITRDKINVSQVNNNLINIKKIKLINNSNKPANLTNIDMKVKSIYDIKKSDMNKTKHINENEISPNSKTKIVESHNVEILAIEKGEILTDFNKQVNSLNNNKTIVENNNNHIEADSVKNRNKKSGTSYKRNKNTNRQASIESFSNSNSNSIQNAVFLSFEAAPKNKNSSKNLDIEKSEINLLGKTSLHLSDETKDDKIKENFETKKIRLASVLSGESSQSSNPSNPSDPSLKDKLKQDENEIIVNESLKKNRIKNNSEYNFSFLKLVNIKDIPRKNPKEDTVCKEIIIEHRNNDSNIHKKKSSKRVVTFDLSPSKDKDKIKLVNNSIVVVNSSSDKLSDSNLKSSIASSADLKLTFKSNAIKSLFSGSGEFEKINKNNSLFKDNCISIEINDKNKILHHYKDKENNEYECDLNNINYTRINNQNKKLKFKQNYEKTKLSIESIGDVGKSKNFSLSNSQESTGIKNIITNNSQSIENNNEKMSRHFTLKNLNDKSLDTVKEEKETDRDKTLTNFKNVTKSTKSLKNIENLINTSESNINNFDNNIKNTNSKTSFLSGLESSIVINKLINNNQNIDYKNNLLSSFDNRTDKFILGSENDFTGFDYTSVKSSTPTFNTTDCDNNDNIIKNSTNMEKSLKKKKNKSKDKVILSTNKNIGIPAFKKMHNSIKKEKESSDNSRYEEYNIKNNKEGSNHSNNFIDEKSNKIHERNEKNKVSVEKTNNELCSSTFIRTNKKFMTQLENNESKNYLKMNTISHKNNTKTTENEKNFENNSKYHINDINYNVNINQVNSQRKSINDNLIIDSHVSSKSRNNNGNIFDLNNDDDKNKLLKYNTLNINASNAYVSIKENEKNKVNKVRFIVKNNDNEVVNSNKNNKVNNVLFNSTVFSEKENFRKISLKNLFESKNINSQTLNFKFKKSLSISKKDNIDENNNGSTKLKKLFTLGNTNSEKTINDNITLPYINNHENEYSVNNKKEEISENKLLKVNNNLPEISKIEKQSNKKDDLSTNNKQKNEKSNDSFKLKLKSNKNDEINIDKNSLTNDNNKFDLFSNRNNSKKN